MNSICENLDNTPQKSWCFQIKKCQPDTKTERIRKWKEKGSNPPPPPDSHSAHAPEQAPVPAQDLPPILEPEPDPDPPEPDPAPEPRPDDNLHMPMDALGYPTDHDDTDDDDSMQNSYLANDQAIEHLLQDMDRLLTTPEFPALLDKCIFHINKDLTHDEIGYLDDYQYDLGPPRKRRSGNCLRRHNWHFVTAVATLRKSVINLRQDSTTYNRTITRPPLLF